MAVAVMGSSFVWCILHVVYNNFTYLYSPMGSYHIDDYGKKST
jgi:hypothetical protein